MLMLISPAKSLKIETDCTWPQISTPDYLEEAGALIKILQGFDASDIAQLMKISPKLATLNVERFARWQYDHIIEQSPAIFAFQGDVYQGLDVEHLDNNALYFAQQHLRILSGLYGLLRPFDMIQAYRLEMGTKLRTASAHNLYDFWGDKITQNIINQLDAIGSEQIVNLASVEYFKVVKPKKIPANVIKPIFKELKDGQYKVISFFAKKARGMMVRYALEQNITDAEQLKNFTGNGYCFTESLSDKWNWVFTR